MQVYSIIFYVISVTIQVTKCQLQKCHANKKDIFNSVVNGSQGHGFSSRSASNPENQSLESLDKRCFNPDGEDCSWYRECLEKKYPCCNGPHDYAIKYAEHYCRRYFSNYHMFTEKGQKWMRKVKKCLQMSLVPLLESEKRPSCKEIKAAAFTSHVRCYVSLDGDDGVPSFCELDLQDTLAAMWTVKSSLIKELSRTLKGFVDISSECISRLKADYKL